MIKNIQYDYRSIPLSEIDASNEDNRISLSCHYPELDKSVAESGLITPIITAGFNGGFKIISGFKRMNILRRTRSGESVKCLIAKDLEPADQLSVNITENIFSRALNPVEIAHALVKLSAFFTRGEIIEKYLPAMNIQKSEYAFNKYASLEALGDKSKTYLVNGQIPLAAAFQVVKFTTCEQDAFLDIVDASKMGANLINETAQLLFEISMQASKSVSEIMDAIECEGIIANAQLNSNQKTDLIRHKLHALKRPMYEKTLARFKELSTQFESEKISLNPFAYFEKDEISVKFAITGEDDLCRKIEALALLKGSRLAAEFLKRSTGGNFKKAAKGVTSDD